MFTFVKAFILGFSVAAPVGPIGILCIRRTLADGRKIGLACGLGAATADALYGLVAGLGLTALTSILIGQQGVLRTVGCAYLAFLGVQAFRSEPEQREAKVTAGGAWRAWGSTFLLTITNPTTIMSFAAMFSAIAFDNAARNRWLGAPLLAGGVFAGSAAWWLLLSGGVSRLRSRLQAKQLRWVNRASGAVLMTFALVSVLRFLARGS